MKLLSKQQIGDAEFDQIISFLENHTDISYFTCMLDNGKLLRSKIKGYQIKSCSFDVEGETQEFNEVFVLADNELMYPYIYCIFE